MCCILVIFQLGGVGARVTLLRPRVGKVEGVWKVGVVPPCIQGVVVSGIRVCSPFGSMLGMVRSGCEATGPPPCARLHGSADQDIAKCSHGA
jgi:hypothetical protein